MLKKEDGWIDWSRGAKEIVNRMRGFAPWPGAYTTFRGQNCQIWGEAASKEDGLVLPGDDDGQPGTLFMLKGEWYVRCADATVLRVGFVQVEGRKRVKAGDFANGARLASGERFGES